LFNAAHGVPTNEEQCSRLDQCCGRRLQPNLFRFSNQSCRVSWGNGSTLRVREAMGLSDARWKSVTPSAYGWEQDALAFIGKRLPDLDPYRAWSNFEFIADDGTINEVDWQGESRCK